MSAPTLTPPIKWPGGKSYLARRIVALMPPHLAYIEPFGGGASVLLAKNPEGTSETYNDLDRDLTTYFRVLQDPDQFETFRRRVEAIPFSQVEWDDAETALRHHPGADPVDRAAWFFVHCRQSLAGRRNAFAPLSRSRTRRGMNEQASAWQTAVEGLPAVHARLMRVAILNRPALEVIRSQDGPDALFYLDPPYVSGTRTAPSVYAHEMTDSDHRELLDLLLRVRGKVMLSGYPNAMYDAALAGWTRHPFDVPNHAAGGAAKRRMTEMVWCNF